MVQSLVKLPLFTIVIQIPLNLWQYLVHYISKGLVREGKVESYSNALNNQIIEICWNLRSKHPLRTKEYNSGLSPHFVMEKAMAIHSSTLAWKMPWMEEPGGLQSMGSLRVRHDWATSLSLFTFTHWRRERQPTPVFLTGESQGRGSLVGCRLWGRTEPDMTEVT